MARSCLAVVLLVVATSARVGAQQVPREGFTNLQVLPQDIAPDELRSMMSGFTRALGVRCVHCHVGEEGKPLRHEDFPKDEKPTKAKAREMIRMTRDLNEKYLTSLPNRSDPPVRIQCVTCHHGVTQPRTLQDLLRTAYDSGGIDSTLARYGALRERYYGRFAYDFSEVPLADLATQVRATGHPADADSLLAFNVEMNPQSSFAKRQHAGAALRRAFTASADSGAAAYRDFKERYGASLISEGFLNEIGYDLLGAGETDAAIEALALNVAENPQSANAYDSLGEALLEKGDRKRATAAYKKSLELDPSNENAAEKLKELKRVKPRGRGGH
jgi:tetratricopeptide (TPR) repeat protein